ncbi:MULTISPECIES: triose-phosphate isomerase family protein [Subtercola]|uniref:Triosephosphate isomerase n=1 Tax=Subtercola vilae TaxID=2056433 RepID=A0A4T2BDI5_9MICO|nr:MULTISPECIES: triose-phosphate isomerase family protein [Subtercola]MEA9984161.1 triose-phosphate isomerase [Subtercola sp. RTI3]TIH26906.1 triosephosphate isomerase [Subtercola vilae]
MTRTLPAVTVGVSTKMYFSYERSLAYARSVAEIAAEHPAVQSGAVEVFVIPTYPALAETVRILERTPVRVGAQDIATADSGAFTGEVSGAVLAEIGCTLAEVGHAERRRLFGETDLVTRDKTQAALRNGLTPVLCIGERMPGSTDAAVDECVDQLTSALAGTPEGSDLVVAYEPHWAIGAPDPAPAWHIVEVCRGLRAHLASDQRLASFRVIYGGSAGPGLLGQLGTAVDGLFLGRYAHDPAALATVIDEAAALAAVRAGSPA